MLRNIEKGAGNTLENHLKCITIFFCDDLRFFLVQKKHSSKKQFEKGILENIMAKFS